MKQLQRGFTIVELLVVIVVIAILAAISVVAYTGIQDRARDADRQSDINAIHKAIELYAAENGGQYPKQGTVVGMDTEFPITTLKLPRSSIVNPDAPAGTQNSISQSNFAGALDVYEYGYLAWTAAEDTCWSGTAVCEGYKIFYRLKKDNEAKVISGGICKNKDNSWFCN